LNLTKVKQFIQSRQRLLKLEQIQVTLPCTKHFPYEQKKILIVDDELNIRETIEELLTITNYDTKQLTMDKKHLMF
jgi:PleD family two-component response regulator